MESSAELPDDSGLALIRTAATTREYVQSALSRAQLRAALGGRRLGRAQALGLTGVLLLLQRSEMLDEVHEVFLREDGATTREGVFIPRRDTNSLLNRYAGGRIFAGEHHFADFTVRDRGGHIGFRMISEDRRVKIERRASAAAALPSGSVFASLAQSSSFFEPGCIGWSTCADPRHLDGLRLKTYEWAVQPLAVEIVRSIFFADTTMFPSGSVEFDHALVMRDIRHEWHSEGRMLVRPQRQVEA